MENLDVSEFADVYQKLAGLFEKIGEFAEAPVDHQKYEELIQKP